jgi:N-acetylmuramoyl-L-alanine amidase/transposase
VLILLEKELRGVQIRGIMAKTYRCYLPDQNLLLPPSLSDWLPEDHLAYFVSDVVDQLNLSAIESVYEKEERGQPPYHPRMLTKILIYAYCVGVFSSREIQRRLVEDVAFRVLAAGNQPDFRTISDFCKLHLVALQGLFTQEVVVKLHLVALQGLFTQEVVVESEVTPPEPVPQVPQAQAPPPPRRVPLSCAGVARADFSGWKQVNSGDGPKVVSEFGRNPPDRKPQITQPLERAQSDPSTARCDCSGRKQDASSSVDQIGVLIDAIYPVQKMSQTGRPRAPAPQRSPVLSYPAVSRGSLGRRTEGALALGAALALTGLLPFYSKDGGSRQLQDLPTPVVERVVTPLQAPQGSSAPAAPSTAQSFLTRTLGLKIGIIVIDAGHGGHDTGAIGPTGLAEKDICLDVALRLGRIIEQRLPGAEIIFTRTDDTFIPLEKRTDMANEKKADLFLSIHANSSRYEAARGVETYYLNLKGSPEALEVATRENATAQEAVSNLQELVKKIARSDKIEESREFAENIQDSLSRRMQRSAKSARNRGVRRAPFVVLTGANMPSVLAEISFLSNPSDEQLLMKGEYRQRLAEGLYQGVASYLQSLNSITYNLSGRNPAAGRSGSGCPPGLRRLTNLGTNSNLSVSHPV